jgi:hypothetical protein
VSDPASRTVSNIGPRQRRKRLVGGVFALAVAAALLVVLLAVDAGRGWRLLLLGPLWAGALGFFQYREKT